MALKIFEKFSPRANPADTNYPHGSIKNESVPGAKDGTPLDASWGNDMLGFTDALLDEAGITPNGLPDTVQSSQRLDALKTVARKPLELKIFQSPTDNLTKVTTFAGGVGVVYEVRKTSDNSLATIYSDAAGTVEIVQNGTDNVSGSDGEAVFYIADGDYTVTIDAVSAGFVVARLKPFDTVADMKAANLQKYIKNTEIVWDGYYAKGDGGGNSGLLKFGAHTEDGGSIFSIDASTYVEANLNGKSVTADKFGMASTLSNNSTVLQNTLNRTDLSDSVDVPVGAFLTNGVASSKHINFIGAATALTRLKNIPSTVNPMFSFNQANNPYPAQTYGDTWDIEKRNIKKFQDMTLVGSGFAGEVGILANRLSFVKYENLYLKDFVDGVALDIQESLWVTLDNVNTNNSEVRITSTGAPKNANVIRVVGGEYRNPTTGHHALYFSGSEVIKIADLAIEGEAGGAGAISGLTITDSTLVNIDNIYVEKLNNCTDAAVVIEDVDVGTVNNSLISSSDANVIGLHVKGSSGAITINDSRLGSIKVDATTSATRFNNTTIEGLMDIPSGTNYTLKGVANSGSSGCIVARPENQGGFLNGSTPLRNTNHDSSYRLGVQTNSVQAGAPVVTHETADGYSDDFSTKVSAVAGDKLRMSGGSLKTFPGLIENADDRFCVTFMAKASIPRAKLDFTLFANGAKGSCSQYVVDEWRRFFIFSNDVDGTLAESAIFFDMTFNDTVDILIDDMQCVSFAKYSDRFKVIDEFRHINTSINPLDVTAGIDVKTEELYENRPVTLAKETRFEKQISAPVSPREGEVYFADGAGWNPGALGKGLYFYNGTSYDKMS